MTLRQIGGASPQKRSAVQRNVFYADKKGFTNENGNIINARRIMIPLPVCLLCAGNPFQSTFDVLLHAALMVLILGDELVTKAETG